MKAINLYALTRMEDEDLFSFYESALSNREDLHETKKHERDTLVQFVAELLDNGINIEDLDSYFFDYTIQHISKEFDLLKIGSNRLLNIELKSQEVELERICKQLLQNRSYLGHITNNIFSFTYIASTKAVYTLDEDGNLVLSNIQDLLSIMSGFEAKITENLDTQFQAAQFLISPINTPDKFLEHRYFLTDSQEKIKRDIIKILEVEDEVNFVSIKGSAGTGKTLLLYDIALLCASIGKTCIIHCGSLSNGHKYLNSKLDEIDIYPAKSLKDSGFIKNYKFILVDEAQRIYKVQLENIIEKVNKYNMTCIFSHDPVQILSVDENVRQSSKTIEEIEGIHHEVLSKKIRTNKELSSFIVKMLDLTKQEKQHPYNDIDIMYAKDVEEAQNIINHLQQEEYTFINYTSSQFKDTDFDIFANKSIYDTHHVIGQEFDKVLMLLDDNFYYKNDRLVAKAHPCPSYLYDKLFYQGITRTREKLCIVVINNKALCEQLLAIKNHFQ